MDKQRSIGKTGEDPKPILGLSDALVLSEQA